MDAVGLAVFLGMGLFMSLVAELYRRARQKAAMYEQHVPPWERQEEPPRPLGERLLLYGGMALSLAILAAAGWQAQRNMAAMVQADRWVTHIYVVNEEIEHFLMALQDMDTSVRAYVVTGREEDLRPYSAALPECTNRLAALKAQTQDNPAQTQRVAGLETLLGAKLAVLKETIELRRTTGFEAAQALGGHRQRPGSDRGDAAADGCGPGRRGSAARASGPRPKTPACAARARRCCPAGCWVS